MSPESQLAVAALVSILLFASGAVSSRLWMHRRSGRAGGAGRGIDVAGDADDLAALRREVDAVRSELDEIHSSVSHDLRSPIGAALNFLTVFEEDHGARLDADGRAILARVRRSANAALTLLDGLARLARVGRRPLERQLVDVDALVRASFAAALPAGRAVELLVAGPLPPVVADPILLQTAFEELLANALQFTRSREKARITVGARTSQDGVEYWVADDGIGFDPRFASKLFHVFERLHPREEFAGAGAGLAVVRRVAERHGGRVCAEAELERGATIRLLLPAPATGAGP
ncbi:MAG: ATP-binding protein [Deltaproteobacteria bacterium]|nr:ATP-binding protein [Deltaproteobacteria bacterium]